MKHILIILFTFLFFISCKKIHLPGPDTITDIDGNVYTIVTIGNQVWMKENLRTTRCQNGTAIPTLNDAAWQATTAAAYAVYNNDPTNDIIYGKLYNWYAAADPCNICPMGWHVPSDAEWSTLINFLGGEAVAGGKMKTLNLWDSPNVGATNESGFSAVPGGTRAPNGIYGSLGDGGGFWSSTEQPGGNPVGWNRLLGAQANTVSRGPLGGKTFGWSIRCIKN